MSELLHRCENCRYGQGCVGGCYEKPETWIDGPPWPNRVWNVTEHAPPKGYEFALSVETPIEDTGPREPWIEAKIDELSDFVVSKRQAADARAALREALAEGERRGLEKAAEVVEHSAVTMAGIMTPHGFCLGPNAPNAMAYAIRALIPSDKKSPTPRERGRGKGGGE